MKQATPEPAPPVLATYLVTVHLPAVVIDALDDDQIGRHLDTLDRAVAGLLEALRRTLVAQVHPQTTVRLQPTE